MNSQWDSNQGPLAYQSSVLSIRPWSLMKVRVIFHLYISIWWKNQLDWKKLPLLKHILSLLTKGQIWTVFVLQPFGIAKFQTKHPVYLVRRHKIDFSRLRENLFWFYVKPKLKFVIISLMENDENILKTTSEVLFNFWFHEKKH